MLGRLCSALRQPGRQGHVVVDVFDDVRLLQGRAGNGRIEVIELAQGLANIGQAEPGPGGLFDGLRRGATAAGDDIDCRFGVFVQAFNHGLDFSR